MPEHGSAKFSLTARLQGDHGKNLVVCGPSPA